MILKTEVKSWSEFRETVINEIHNIIEDNLSCDTYMCNTYEITGRPFLDIKLVLKFDNRIKSISFKYLNESVDMIAVTLYKKDFENSELKI